MTRNGPLRQYGPWVALVVAAAIKGTPLIFLPYLVVKRRFLAAAIFAAFSPPTGWPA
jgi:hypothetical protein